MNLAKHIHLLKNYLAITRITGFSLMANAQKDSTQYWNGNTQLIPWRIPINKAAIRQADLDRDGDPDLLYYSINIGVPVVWIDDDDDMRREDTEGDADSDCLLIDRNKDGLFAGPEDFCIDNKRI